MHFSSGYSVEPYEYIDIFEKYGGLLPSDYPEVMEKGVEIFQIETRNPHFHEDRGSVHLQEMLHASFGCIYNSQICPPPLSKELQEQLEKLNSESTGKKSKGANVKLCKMEPIKGIPVADLADELKKNSITFYKYGSIK
jgi:mannosyl-3-phosphoglycerate synthase